VNKIFSALVAVLLLITTMPAAAGTINNNAGADARASAAALALVNNMAMPAMPSGGCPEGFSLMAPMAGGIAITSQNKWCLATMRAEVINHAVQSGAWDDPEARAIIKALVGVSTASSGVTMATANAARPAARPSWQQYLAGLPAYDGAWADLGHAEQQAVVACQAVWHGGMAEGCKDQLGY